MPCSARRRGRLHARNAAAYDCHSFHYSLMSYIVSVGQQFTTADAGLPIYFPLRPRYLAAGVVLDAHLVQQGFDVDLMHLHAQHPRIVTEHQTGHLLVGQDGNPVAVLAVSRPSISAIVYCHLSRNIAHPDSWPR